MELQGIIKKIGELQTFASGFQKKELVIVTDQQYPQPIAIEFLKDKSDLLDNYKEGDKVKVSINVGGREWTSPQGEVKYFNTITGWRMEKLDGADVTSEPAKSKTTATPQEAFADDDSDDSGLPF